MLTTDTPAPAAPAATRRSPARLPLVLAVGPGELAPCAAPGLALGSRAVPLGTVVGAPAGGADGADAPR
ncbi:hypothetical protein [Kitasatospora sp. NPDC056184]|uniref:hypothetical protein n=1 Tax=Kitasatospora sp. NPDC056184 TaxID=3345738 RepID=UPI0035DE364B